MFQAKQKFHKEILCVNYIKLNSTKLQKINLLTMYKEEFSINKHKSKIFAKLFNKFRTNFCKILRENG